MYCNFYGFKEKPFTVTPNPRFVFLSKNHKEAFAHLLYGIDNHAGFIALTGEVGTGKTTVLRTLLDQLDVAAYRSALILNPFLSGPELALSINREFGIAWEGMDNAELLDSLNCFLLDENHAGRTVVLVIDEAQNLETQVLEQIRLISNLETETDKLIQIVLAGQPELTAKLQKPELRQFGQRITVRYHLTSMDLDDTGAYIEHRLEVAGGWRSATFTKAAVKKIFRYSKGIPRLINIVCDRALLIGYINESRNISGRMAAQAIDEVREKSIGAYISRIAWIAALLSILVAFGTIFLIPQGMSVKMPLPPRPAVPARLASKTANFPGEDIPINLRKELAGMKETESVVNAFNALARLWKVSPLPDQTAVLSPQDMDRIAEERGLSLVHFNGSLKWLLSADSPALLEFSLSGTKGKRYLALVGREKDRLHIVPPINGRTYLDKDDLASCWSGRAYLPLKNFRNIPRLIQGMSGEAVTRLQLLLREAGVYKGEPNGIFNRETAAAIMTFQGAHGIKKSGRLGNLTLFYLYHDVRGYSTPRLERMKGQQPG
jgi:general secretion pathway protein A